MGVVGGRGGGREHIKPILALLEITLERIQLLIIKFEDTSPRPAHLQNVDRGKCKKAKFGLFYNSSTIYMYYRYRIYTSKCKFREQKKGFKSIDIF